MYRNILNEAGTHLTVDPDWFWQKYGFLDGDWLEELYWDIAKQYFTPVIKVRDFYDYSEVSREIAERLVLPLLKAHPQLKELKLVDYFPTTHNCIRVEGSEEDIPEDLPRSYEIALTDVVQILKEKFEAVSVKQ